VVRALGRELLISFGSISADQTLPQESCDRPRPGELIVLGRAAAGLAPRPL
jgi:hypothetical protein